MPDIITGKQTLMNDVMKEKETKNSSKKCVNASGTKNKQECVTLTSENTYIIQDYPEPRVK